jgi:LacI family transcriptional regulator
MNRILHQPVSQKTLRVALLFNANKVYDREIIAGIGHYLSSTRTAWDLYMEEDFRCRPQQMMDWNGDGIIADFDDPDIAALAGKLSCPIVAVGSSYAEATSYPAGIPYVATDNQALLRMACEHLLAAGLPRMALYSMPARADKRWAQEREHAFRAQLALTGEQAEIWRGDHTDSRSWQQHLDSLAAWLHSLPKPVGIIAVNDARARHVLQACLASGIAVPEEVAVVGIDNDPISQTLTRIPLSSVIQGTREMGQTAARLLSRMIHGARECPPPVLVPPAGMQVATSSQHEALRNPYVMRARHYIRQYAGQGIKAEQVVDHIGIARSTLDAHFRKELGRTIHDEIMLTKLARAQELLRSGRHSCALIAEQCGFTSLQYMHAVFKRELGCTPREYQHSQRSN